MKLEISAKLYPLLIATVAALDKVDKKTALSQKMIELGQALVLLAQLGREDFDNIDKTEV